MKPKRLSVVVPAFNEQDNLRPFFAELTRVLDTDLSGYEAEIIFVDDGSTDDTLSCLRALSREDARVKAISFSRNFGHQAALTAGMKAATGDAVVTMDCDFQDPPSIVPDMVRKWAEGARIVYARRKSRVDGVFKRLTASVYYKILSVSSDVHIPRNVGDFRLVDRVVLNHLTRLDEHARYLRGMVAWLGFRYDFVDFDRPDRAHGETHYTFGKMTRLAMDGVVNFTFFPLRAALWVGIVTVLISVGFLVYMGVDIAVNRVKYPLFKWLTVIVFGFVGAQFMLIWILGEYIGRIYNDVRKRPIYVVGETVNMDAKPPKSG